MKGKMIGMGTKEYYIYYILKKEQHALRLLKEILIEFDNSFYPKVCSLVNKKSTSDEIKYSDSNSEQVENNIADIIDQKFNFNNQDAIIDIIFGNEKIFVLGFMKPEKVNNFRKIMNKNFDFENELDKLRTERINKIICSLRGNFSLSIQSAAIEFQNKIRKVLDQNKIRYKIRMENSPNGYGIESTYVSIISKKKFYLIKEYLFKDFFNKYLGFELIFSSKSQKIWFTHDSDIVELKKK